MESDGISKAQYNHFMRSSDHVAAPLRVSRSIPGSKSTRQGRVIYHSRFVSSRRVSSLVWLVLCVCSTSNARSESPLDQCLAPQPTQTGPTLGNAVWAARSSRSGSRVLPQHRRSESEIEVGKSRHSRSDSRPLPVTFIPKQPVVWIERGRTRGRRWMMRCIVSSA